MTRRVSQELEWHLLSFASFSGLLEQELVSSLRFWLPVRERQLDLSSPWINAQSNTDSNTRACVY